MNFFTKLLKWISFGHWGTTTPTTTDTTTNTTTTRTGQTKRALCMGINDYPGTGNDLKGCVNDAQEWAKLFKNKFGFHEVELLIDSQVTTRNVEDKLKALIAKSDEDDILAVTYSGHGSNLPDKNGDEVDGKDETLYLYDGHFTDDKIKDIISAAKEGVKITIISDSCHSGTVTRGFLSVIEDEGNPAKVKFMPSDDDAEAALLASVPIKKRVFVQNDMREILITGCTATEYSYDAYFGKPMGAMSHFATSILKGADDLTYIQFYEMLRKQLPSSRYPQSPQLEGSTENKNRVMFT